MLLYEMTVGRSPFAGKDQQATCPPQFAKVELEQVLGLLARAVVCSEGTAVEMPVVLFRVIEKFFKILKDFERS